MRIMRCFYARMAADPMLGFFFANKNILAVADQQSRFMLRAMGRSESYSGLPPAQAHAQLPPILPGHFDRRAVLLRQTLTQEKIPAPLIEAWISFEAAFRDAIVKDSKES